MQLKSCETWERVAEIVGITLQHRITKQGENCASMVDESKDDFLKNRNNPSSIASWNVNGLKARWGKGKSAEPLKDIWRDKKRLRELPFPAVVERLGNPEVLFALESKITLGNLLKLPNFQTWRKSCRSRDTAPHMLRLLSTCLRTIFYPHCLPWTFIPWIYCLICH